jgi:hypothetical protein
MPAPRVSQKLSGGPKGTLNRRTKGPAELDPTMLGSITLNRDAIQALTIAQAKVQVTISAGGTTAILVSEETGRQIGGLDDLAKLLGLRSFVTKEKKATASSDVQTEILSAAFRASENAKASDPNFVQKKLDNSFVLAARPYRMLAGQIEVQLKALRDNYHEGSSEYKTLLTAYCNGILNAAGDTLTAMVRGEKEKGLMEAALLRHGVPAYVRNKLQLKSLAITKDMDLSRILFPQDPSKGLALSVAEWRTEGFVARQGPIMINNEGIMRIFRNRELFLELIGMTLEEFSNAEDPRVQRVLKTRILVVPPFEDHIRVLEPLSRSNFRGFGLPQTAMDQSKDRLANLCAVFVRAYAFSVRMAETIPDFFNRIVGEGVIDKPSETRGNYAKQMLQALEEMEPCSLIPKLRLKESNDALMSWIDRECKIIPNGALHQKIATALAFQGGGTPEATQMCIPTARRASVVRVDMVKPISTGAEKDLFKAFKHDALSLKEKSVKGKKTLASSVLSRQAKSFLKSIARDHSPMLAQSMEGYFRGFYSEDIQSAAVRIAEARFDDLDELLELGSSDDNASDDNASSDEEDES